MCRPIIHILKYQIKITAADTSVSSTMGDYMRLQTSQIKSFVCAGVVDLVTGWLQGRQVLIACCVLSIWDATKISSHIIIYLGLYFLSGVCSTFKLT